MDAESTLLQITFKPSSPNGYLFYSGNMSEAGYLVDFLSLSLVNGRLELRYDLGSGVQGLLSDILPLNLWHTVLVTRDLRTASMVVNGIQFGPVVSPGGFSQLNVPGVVSIGGLRDYNILSPLANDDITGFIGCISSLTVSIYSNGVLLRTNAHEHMVKTHFAL